MVVALSAPYRGKRTSLSYGNGLLLLSDSEASFSVQDPQRVRHLFNQLAPRYDLANRVLSGGIDRGWRKKVASQVARHAPCLSLDVACGSGDFYLALQHALPDSSCIVGIDFSEPLLQRALPKGCQRLIVGDALNLPFENGTFDAVTVAFGLRNMASYPGAAAEMGRVLRSGGRLHILDFSLPSHPMMRWFYRSYLHHLLPCIAGILTGQTSSYRYLGGSIETFPSGAGMLKLLASAGYCESVAHPMTFGVVTHYEAVWAG